MPHPKTCHNFILCFEYKAVVHYCGEGLHFSPRDHTCKRIEEAVCTVDDTLCNADNDPNNIIVTSNPYDCQSFFLCFDHKAMQFSCAEGQHWNQDLKTCVLEKNSDCIVSFF